MKKKKSIFDIKMKHISMLSNSVVNSQYSVIFSGTDVGILKLSFQYNFETE